MIEMSNSQREILSPGAASVASGGRAAYAGMDRTGWLEAGRRLATRTTRDRWALGDWAACAGRHHGDLTLAAREIGLSAGPLFNLASMARQVHPSRRREGLSWDHHAAVASLPAAAGDRLLDDAEAGGWSRERVRGAVRAARRAASRRRDPSPARDIARRVRRRLKRERKTSGDGMRCMAAIADEIATHPKLDDLHGNTQPGLARAVRREFAAAAAGAVYAHRAAGEIAARRIEGAPFDTHTAVCAVLTGEIPVLLRLVGARIDEAARSGLPADARHVLATDLEAAINRHMAAAAEVIARSLEPALKRLAGAA